MNDLISKDKLYNDLNKLWDIANEQGYKELSALISDRIVPLIVAQPTVEAKEVVHGRWIKMPYSRYKCEICGNSEVIVDDYEQLLYEDFADFCEGNRYCRLCGAKMRGLKK